MKNNKILKLGLLPLIIVAIAAGIGAGMFFPDGLTRVFVTFNSIFRIFSASSFRY